MMKTKITQAQFLIFLFVFLSCSFSFLNSDDFLPACCLFTDLLHTIKGYYYTWCARLPAMFLVFLLLHKKINFLTIPLINIANSFFFLYFLKKLYQISFHKKELNLVGYCLFSVALIFYLINTDSWFEVIQWKTGAIYYFYGFVLCLTMIDHLFIEQKSLINNKILTLYFFLGTLLGGYNELIALFMLCIYFIFFMYHLYYIPINQLLKKFKLQLSFLIGTILGLSIILTAPGTWARKKFASGAVNAYNESLLYKLKFAFSHYFQYKIKLYFAVFALGIVLFILGKYLFSKTMATIEKKIIFNFSLFLMSLLILASFAYTYEGHIGGRITFLYDVILFMICVQGFFYLTPNKKYLPHGNVLYIDKLALFTLIIVLGYPLFHYYQSYIHHMHQIASFNSLENKTNQDVVLYHQDTTSSFFIPLNLTADPNRIENKLFAKYYGIKSVIAIQQPKDELFTNQNKTVVYTDHCEGNVDIINDTPTPNSFVASKFLSVSGWLTQSITTQTKPPESVLIVLTDSQGMNTFIKTRPKIRPDVGSYFKNPKLNSSGYISVANVSEISGDYTLRLAYIEGQFIKICPQFKIAGVFKTNEG